MSALFTHEVPLILQRFRKQYLEVGVLLEEHRSEALIKLLCQGLIDADQVRYISISDSNLQASLGVAWRDDCKTPALQNLLAVIGQAM